MTIHYKHLRAIERREEQQKLDEMHKLRMERAQAEYSTMLKKSETKKGE